MRPADSNTHPAQAACTQAGAQTTAKQLPRNKQHNVRAETQCEPAQSGMHRTFKPKLVADAAGVVGHQEAQISPSLDHRTRRMKPVVARPGSRDLCGEGATCRPDVQALSGVAQGLGRSGFSWIGWPVFGRCKGSSALQPAAFAGLLGY